MSAAEYGVNTGRMSSDIRSLRSGLSQTRGHIRTLEDRMQALNAMWDGDANETMRRRFQGDRETLNELCSLLEELIHEMEADRQNYDTCESQVESVVNALMV